MQYRRPLRWIELIDDLTSVEFLLSIVYAGRNFYFSTRPRVLLDEQNNPIQYDGGLSVSWSDALDLFNESPSLLAVPLKLFFPVDVAELVAKGHDLWRGAGELSLWIEGKPYEDRIILMKGSIVDPNYGAKGEPVKFSLEANGFEDTSLTHSPTQKISSQTWQQPAQASKGIYYPIVFGTPGVYTETDGTPTTTHGSPVYPVNTLTETAVVAMHEVEANSLTLINTSNGATSVKAITTEFDLLGQIVSVVNYGGMLYNPGDEFWAIWDQGGGGLWNERRTTARTGAGELIEYFLNKSSLDFDRGVWRAVQIYLDQTFHFAGYVNDAVQPWRYIKENFLRLLPLSVYATSEGISCVLWYKDAKKSDAVGTIEPGGGVARYGPVQYENQDLVNDLRLNFALDGEQDENRRTIGVIGDHEPSPQTEQDLFSTEYSRASFFRYGTISQTRSTNVIYETATAINVLQWQHRARALPYRTIQYRVPIRMGFLKRGDLVLLTDPEIHISDYLAIVRNIKWENGKPRLTLVLVDDPPREDRL